MKKKGSMFTPKEIFYEFMNFYETQDKKMMRNFDVFVRYWIKYLHIKPFSFSETRS